MIMRMMMLVMGIKPAKLSEGRETLLSVWHLFLQQCVAGFSPPVCGRFFSTVCSSFSPMCLADPLFLLLSKTPIIASHAATRRLPFPKVCAQYPYIFHNFHIHPFSDGENKSEHQEHSAESCT